MVDATSNYHPLDLPLSSWSLSFASSSSCALAHCEWWSLAFVEAVACWFELGLDVEAEGFFPSEVLSLEEPRILKDCPAPDVEDMLYT